MLLFDEGKFSFTLIDELKDVTTLGWILIAAAAVIAAVLIIFLVQRRRTSNSASIDAAPSKKENATLVLVHGALCIALSFVLSYFKLFSMPLGGSITLASMLPLMVYSNRYGIKYGMMAGLVYVYNVV